MDERVRTTPVQCTNQPYLIIFCPYQTKKKETEGTRKRELTEIIFGDAAAIENVALEDLTGRISATTAPPNQRAIISNQPLCRK